MGNNNIKCNERNAKRQRTVELTENDIDMLIKSTKFTRDEIIEWHVEFLRDYPSGRMTKHEFTQFYKQFQPSQTSESFCKNIFRIFDRNSNGYIEFPELMFSISLTSNEMDRRKKVELIFRIYDVDGNGSINKREFKKIIKSIYLLLSSDSKALTKNVCDQINDNLLNDLFDKIDADKNNSISLKEFVDCCLNDTNMLNMLAPNA
jgi:Ca2+-binding EF-hand superfamily protein